MPVTLLDIAKANGSDMVVGLIDEALKTCPELTGRVMFRGVERQIANVGASRTIKGTNYKTLVRTAYPTAPFRNANEGTTPVKGTYENREVSTYILNPRWEADKAVADGYEDGAAAYIAMEANAMLRAAMIALCTQFYYGRGTGGDAKGHPGLIDSINSTHVVDAGGTTADTGSSCWAVKFGTQDVQWVFGQGGSLDLSDLRTETLTDSNGKKFTGYVQEILAYAGVQVGSIHSVGRIKKLTADSGKGLTDARLGALLATFPAHQVPDAFFCTRRSLEQLRASRTATNATGSEAPTPTEYEGIPLIPTDAISNTEALTL